MPKDQSAKANKKKVVRHTPLDQQLQSDESIKPIKEKQKKGKKNFNEQGSEVVGTHLTNKILKQAKEQLAEEEAEESRNSNNNNSVMYVLHSV